MLINMHTQNACMLTHITKLWALKAKMVDLKIDEKLDRRLTVNRHITCIEKIAQFLL